MELTNKQRKYLGLEPIEPHWERVELPNRSASTASSSEKDILFFDGDTLRKIIHLEKNGSYYERSCRQRTQDNRTMFAPFSPKGKPKRLTRGNIQRCPSYGMYFFYNGTVFIANYTTQQTYFSSTLAGIPPMGPEELQSFLDKWIADTDEDDLAELQRFRKAKRRHYTYKEGDFFRFKYDRRHYGYGRILFDVRKWIKDGGAFWDILMGKALCVAVYHIITERSDINIEDLQSLQSCPSAYIMDNGFYYGEYEIIGNAPVPANADYPILYGRSINALDRNKICFCRGRVYREVSLEHQNLVAEDFTNNAIGFSLNVTKPLVEKCIQAGSNEPFWALNCTNDLRNPMFAKELTAVLKQMSL